MYYLGYELNLATYVPSRRESAASRPHLALGMTVRSGNQDRGPAGAAAVIRVARRFPATEVIADRGYTQLAITSFWLHLHEIGLRVVHDLKSQQRGARDSTVPGVLLIDGHPFTAGIPENLRDITLRGRPNTAQNSNLPAKSPAVGSFVNANRIVSSATH